MPALGRGVGYPALGASEIKVRGPNGLTLALGAWLVWASATRILVVVVLGETAAPGPAPLQQPGPPEGLLGCLVAIGFFWDAVGIPTETLSRDSH